MVMGLTTPIGTALANSMEFLGIRPRVCFKDLLDNVTLTLHNVTLA